MTRLNLTRKETPLEKPTVGPDGRPLWQSNGERQRYAQRMLEEVDHGAVFAAAGQVLFHRKLKAGEIGPDDGITPTQEEMVTSRQDACNKSAKYRVPSTPTSSGRRHQSPC